jgi:CBS-domain-containing membrane protein
MKYFRKMRGSTQSPPRVRTVEVLLSLIGAFVGIAALGLMHTLMFDHFGFTLLLGSFGATAVLVFGASRSPMAQPRNVLGGHVLSALIGVTAQQSLGTAPWLAAALAVSAAVAVMHLTKTFHPPGGATALIAVVGGDPVHNLGYAYAILPAGVGAFALLVIGLVVNNIPKNRRYPEYWL